MYILLEDSLKNYDDFLHKMSISIFLVELHLDFVLEVLLVVRFEFLLLNDYVSITLCELTLK